MKSISAMTELKNKTAMTELIESSRLELERVSKERGYSDTYAAGMTFKLTETIRKATELLETEKQQIIDAYFNGGKDVSTRDHEDAELFLFTWLK